MFWIFKWGQLKKPDFQGAKLAGSHLGVTQTKVELCKKNYSHPNLHSQLSLIWGNLEGKAIKPSRVCIRRCGSVQFGPGIVCVTLGKSLLQSEPQFSHSEHEGVGCSILGVTSSFQVLQLLGSKNSSDGTVLSSE